MNLKIKIEKKDCAFFFFFLYVLALSAFNLGSGFDWIMARGSFILFIVFSLLYSKGKLEITRYFIWALVFWAFYFFSLIWANNANDTLRYSSECIQILGMALCLPLLIKTWEDIHKAIFAIILALLGTVVRIIIMTPQSAWGTERLGEAIGTNSNLLGMCLAFGAVLSLYMFHNTAKNKCGRFQILKMLFYIFSCVFLAGISLFTGSRKTVAIIVISIAVYEILRVRGWRTLVRVIIVAVLALVFLYFVFNSSILYPILGRRLANMMAAFTGSGQVGTSMTERSFYIQEAMELFSKNPLFGYGGNNFMTYMREIGYSHVAYSHNNYTEMLSTLGIVGFIIYYSYWIVAAVRLIVSFFRSRNEALLLFTILVILELVLDYWVVSYVNVFIQILLMLGITALQVSKFPMNTPTKTKREIQIWQTEVNNQSDLCM